MRRVELAELIADVLTVWNIKSDVHKIKDIAYVGVVESRTGWFKHKTPISFRV